MQTKENDTQSILKFHSKLKTHLVFLLTFEVSNSARLLLSSETTGATNNSLLLLTATSA